MDKDRDATDRAAAEAAWAGMTSVGVVPVPRHYEVWFNYKAGRNKVLTHRMDAMLAAGDTFSPPRLEALYADYVGSAAEKAMATEVQEVQDIVRCLLDQVTQGQQGVRSYGQALADWSVSIERDLSTHALKEAVAKLSEETRRAFARNAMLEQQLTSSVVRVNEMQLRLTEAEHKAMTDPLTGLANRTAFDAALAEAILHTRGSSTKMAFLLIDIDHFKRFNDCYGHPTGDLVLRLVARVLAENVKGRDTVARYGGEEFAIVLPGASLDAGAIVGEQIRQALSRMPLVNRASREKLGTITVSIGVSCYGRNEAATDLIERADRALYHAKHSGRNLVCTEAMDLQPRTAQAG